MSEPLLTVAVRLAALFAAVGSLGKVKPGSGGELAVRRPEDVINVPAPAVIRPPTLPIVAEAPTASGPAKVQRYSPLLRVQLEDTLTAMIPDGAENLIWTLLTLAGPLFLAV
jgi:hypothetical protein